MPSNKDSPRRACSKTLQEYCNATDDEMRAACENIKRSTISTYTRSYHVKVVNGLLYSNKDYHRFGYLDNNLCKWCRTPNQTSRHLLWECSAVKAFRTRLSRLCDRWTGGLKECLLGLGSMEQSFIFTALNIFIHRCNHRGDNLSTRRFLAELRCTERTESSIAARNNKTRIHLRKWMHIMPVVNLHT